MANEFIARKGLIVLNNGAKITGSLGVMGDLNATGYNITASNLSLLGSASIDGDITIAGNLTVGNADVDVVKFLAEVSSSILPDINNAFDLGSGPKSWRDLYVSGTAYVGTVEANTVNLDNLTVYQDLTVQGNTILGNAASDSVKITGSFFASGSSAFVGPQTIDGNIVLLNSSQIRLTSSVESTLFGFYDGSNILGSYYQMWGNDHASTTQRGSAEFVYDNRNNANANFHIASFDGSIWTQKFIVNDAGAQVTGSLGITGIQTINDTTNSTNYTDGALIVKGGVGIARDVNISGSLTINGLFTAVSTSIQYVTSSQLLVADNQIIVNTTNALRYGGLSVVDSGSATPLTGSLYWDSLYNRWIEENITGDTIRSSILVLGPENTGGLGTEVGFTEGRIPVATDAVHIDTDPTYSPLRVEGLVLHAEGGLVVTGSVTSSVGFSGDGSQLTGIVTNLNITGSQGGTGTVSLKTQALTVDGINGIAATVSGQTLTISGSNATTSSIGVASFTGSNFTVTGGQVSSNPINFNSVDLNLGSTYTFGLQNITPYGASTPDQVSLQGGAIINGVLFTSASNPDVDTGTEVVATVATGSYDGAFFDYIVKKSNNYRIGTVMVVWDANDNLEFTDTSTNDLGNTGDVVFTVDALNGSARLKATVTTNDWIIKTAIRAL